MRLPAEQPACKMPAMTSSRFVSFGTRNKLRSIADGLVVAVAISLPWSTSATSILIVTWLLALLPTLNVAAIRREVMSAAGGTPMLLWVFAALGMLWSDVTWSERLDGLGAFHKLLVLPLLLTQFRHSDTGSRVLWGFLASVISLLVVSWALVLLPGLPWRGRVLGVPVKDYISQSGIFVLCAFAMIDSRRNAGGHAEFRMRRFC